MTKYNLLFGLLFLAGVIFPGCEDDETDPFVGEDNYIVSFALNCEGTDYAASFRGDTILLTVPHGVSLSEAVPTLVCSENTTIKPDPATVTNWAEQMYLVVTAHNGAERKYLYVPSVGEFSTSGVIVLNTQAEVDAFGALGYTRLEGSLIIGRQGVGKDTITSLAALSSLRHVTNNVALNSMYKGHEFTGLENLETIGGSLQVNSADSLWNIAMNNLTSVGGDLSITSAAVSQILCPALERVGGTMTLAAAFTEVDFSALREVSGALALNGKTSVARMDFPQLERVGGAVSMSMSSVKKLEFPVLQSCAGMTIGKSTLGLLYCPLLASIDGPLSIAANPLYEISFPELTQAASVNLACPDVSQMDMPKLQTIGGDCSLQLAGLDISKLASLESIGGKLTLSVTAEQLQMPAKLTAIGTLVLSAGIGELDIRGMNIGEIQFSGSDLENTTLRGDAAFAGGFNLNGLKGQLPQLDGFEEIAYLTCSDYLSMSGQELTVAGIRKINGDISFRCNASVNGVYFPDLEEVAGNFDLYSNFASSTFPGGFPKLTTIEGNAEISIYPVASTFPVLATVGGDCSVASGYSSLGPSIYPALRQVGGTLEIVPQGRTTGSTIPSTKNTTLTNLDFISALESIGGFRILRHTALTDYSALKNCIATCPAANWDVVGNGNAYEPTYEDLVEGNLWKKTQE